MIGILFLKTVVCNVYNTDIYDINYFGYFGCSTQDLNRTSNVNINKAYSATVNNTVQIGGSISKSCITLGKYYLI